MHQDGVTGMTLLLKTIRNNKLLWLLVLAPLPLLAEHLAPEKHTLLFLLSVIAIVPLAALLSLATEAVAAKTGDAVGGLLNATLGNLTELIICLTALRAGEYVLVKASLVGAIVTNTLFMMGACFLIGGLRHKVQEFNLPNARLQLGMLFIAGFGLMVPSAITAVDQMEVTQTLSLGVAILLIVTYGLGPCVFAGHAPPVLFVRVAWRGARRPLAHAGRAGDAGWRNGDRGAGERGLRRLADRRIRDAWLVARLHRFRDRRHGRCCGRDGDRVFGRGKGPAGPERGHRLRQFGADRAVRGARCWC